MAALEITSRDAERIARSFNDLIKPAGLNRMRRKAVNEVGSAARKELRAVLPAIIGTSAAALTIQGKASAPGSTNPAYRLRLANRISVHRLKASHRKTRRRRGRQSLALVLPSGKTVRFGSVARGDDRAFRLLAAGPLPERRLGGVYVSPKGATIFDRYDAIKPIRRKAERDLPAVIDRLIQEHLAKRKR